MAGHTPGPWGWRDTACGAVLWGEHGKRPVVLDCGRVRGMSEFQMRGRNADADLMVPLDITSANARLIAAAPAMYKALEEIEDVCSRRPSGDGAAQAIQISRAAIAKARESE